MCKHVGLVQVRLFSSFKKIFFLISPAPLNNFLIPTLLTQTFGSPISAMATDSLRFWPPLSLDAITSAWSARSTLFKALDTCNTNGAKGGGCQQKRVCACWFINEKLKWSGSDHYQLNCFLLNTKLWESHTHTHTQKHSQAKQSETGTSIERNTHGISKSWVLTGLFGFSDSVQMNCKPHLVENSLRL